jgi:hypothetical protein
VSSERATTAIGTIHGRVREAVNDIVTTSVSTRDSSTEHHLLDAHLPTYHVVLTENAVLETDTGTVFGAAKGFDFMTTRSLLVTAFMTAGSLPRRLLGRAVVAPHAMMLDRDSGALPGWLLLGEVPRREIVCGAHA